MTQAFKVIEKFISTVLIIWGILLLYASSLSIFHLFDIGIKYGDLSWETISLFKILKNYHLILLLPLATIFAGTLLVLNKKIGWTTSLVVLLLYSFLFLIPTGPDGKILNSQNIILLSLTIGVMLISLCLFFILLLKPFRLKYQATKKTFWAVGVITVLIIIDKALILLTS